MSRRQSIDPQSEPPATAAQSEGVRDLGHEAHRLARLLRRSLEAELASLGLTAPQAAVLLAVADGPPPVSPAAVADRLGMDRPTLSGVVGRLERDGWLGARANPADGRSRLLRLTPRSERALPDVRSAAGRTSAAALRGLRPGDATRLLGLIDAVARSLEDRARKEQQA
jgi:DNA-binding MarR family transcriptional regulator